MTLFQSEMYKLLKDKQVKKLLQKKIMTIHFCIFFSLQDNMY